MLRQARRQTAAAKQPGGARMRFRVVLGALLSHWRRHPVELATLLVGLMVATALWSGVQALNAEARASYARAAALVGADSLARVEAPGGGRVALADFAALRRAGWPVSPVIDGALPREGWDIRVIGVEPFTLPDAASVSDSGDRARRRPDRRLPDAAGAGAGRARDRGAARGPARPAAAGRRRPAARHADRRHRRRRAADGPRGRGLLPARGAGPGARDARGAGRTAGAACPRGWRGRRPRATD